MKRKNKKEDMCLSYIHSNSKIQNTLSLFKIIHSSFLNKSKLSKLIYKNVTKKLPTDFIKVQNDIRRNARLQDLFT